MTDYTNIQKTICVFIKENLLNDPTINIDPDTALISSGLVDSMSLIRLINFVEDNADMDINPNELTPTDFETVNTFLGVLKELKG